mmetsp:Transcript_22171/g.33291  ORF Transcript_22171/g.33291 Transcript_22171/m.33291 type:complete len:298 (-) Transcript_22171:91-984(-)
MQRRKINQSRQYPNLWTKIGPPRRLNKLILYTTLVVLIAVVCFIIANHEIFNSFNSPASTAYKETKLKSGKDCSKMTEIKYSLVAEKEMAEAESSTRRSAGWKQYAAFNECMQPLSVWDWAQSLSHSDSSIDQLTDLLKLAPYPSFFFETKGVTKESMKEKQFEFVVIDAPALTEMSKNRIDRTAFMEHFQNLPIGAAGSIFTNLGGDATLVSPKKMGSTDNMVYGHLAAFIHGAPRDQLRHIWTMVCSEYVDNLQRRGSHNPVWLSTSGLGVLWLHFRFDSSPKYYQFAPFANERD